MNMSSLLRIAAAAIFFMSGSAFAQTGGILSPGQVLGNFGATAAPAKATNLLNGANTWTGQQTFVAPLFGAASGTALNMNAGDNSIISDLNHGVPVGVQPPGTTAQASLNVFATTSHANSAEFLATLIVNSTTGAGLTNGTGDKLPLYTSIAGQAGSGNIWALNTVTGLTPQFPSTSNAQGYELDFNNFARDYSPGANPSAIPAPFAVGFEVSGDTIGCCGANTVFRSTMGMGVNGGSWFLGVGVFGDVSGANSAAFYEFTSPGSTYGMQLNGSHTYGLYVSSNSAQDYLNQPVCISCLGLPIISGAALDIHSPVSTNERLIFQGHQTLSSGMAISSVNDAATALQPLELKVSTLQITGATGDLTFAAGLQIGVPTGGDKGFGTLNIQGPYFVNGNAFASSNLAGIGTGVAAAINNPLNGTGGLVGFNGNIGAASGTSLTTSGSITGTILNATTGYRVNGAAASGNMLLGNGTNFVNVSMSGDCAIVSSGAITCTKTNGSSLGTFATQNFAAPPVIGGTTPAAITGTSITATAFLYSAGAVYGNGIIGVSCSGSPTSSFASSGGVVTHC